MKKIYLFIILISNLGIAQAPAIQAQLSFGGSQYDEAKCVLTTTDGYILAGNSRSNDGQVTGNHGYEDIWIVKTDNVGAIQWQKSYGGSSYDGVSSMKLTADGGYILAGYSESTNGDVTGGHGNYDYWVLKLDATGTIQWQKTYGGTGDDRAKDIQKTTDGGYILAGYTDSSNGDLTFNQGSYDYWIVKITATGTIQWQINFGSGVTTYDQANNIQQTSDGGYIFIGSSGVLDPIINYPINQNIWIYKLDASGNTSWITTFGGSNDDYGKKIIQTADNGYIVLGAIYSNDGSISGNHGGSDYLVVKLDVYGNVQWQKCYGGTGQEIANDIKITPDGGYILAGISDSSDGDVSNNIGFNDYWLVKTDASGNIQWEKSMGGSQNDVANSLQITSDNGYVVVGYDSLANGDITVGHGQQDYWAVKLAPDVLATQQYAQNKLELFPNPIKETFEIQTLNPIMSYKIIDVTGKIVQQEVNTTFQAINVSNLTKGMYILEASNTSETYRSKLVKE